MTLVELFMKITGDINKHNKKDATKFENLFKQKIPYVTYLLIAINCIFFLIPFALRQYNYVIDMLCVHGPSIRAGQYYRLITGIFLHGSIFHLFFNCYALYIIGTQLESFLGKTKFLIIYLFSAITGSLMSIIFSDSLSIGASGAIFGLFGSLLYFGYHYRIYLGNVIKSQIIPLILVNLIFGFMVSGIDNAAHIGGLVGGLLMTMALGIKYKSSKSEQVNGIVISLMYVVFLIALAFFMS